MILKTFHQIQAVYWIPTKPHQKVAMGRFLIGLIKHSKDIDLSYDRSIISKNWKTTPAHPSPASWQGKQAVLGCGWQLFSMASKYFNIISWQDKAETESLESQLNCVKGADKKSVNKQGEILT